MNTNQLATSVNPKLISSQTYESSQLNHFFHQFYPDELTTTGQYQPEHLEFHGNQQPRCHEESASLPYGDFASDYERVSHGIETMSVNSAPNAYYSTYPAPHQLQSSMIATQTSPKYIREAHIDNPIPATSETEERNASVNQESSKEKKKKSGSRTGSGSGGSGIGKKKGSRCKLETEPDDGPKKRRKSVTTLQAPEGSFHFLGRK